MSTAAVAVRRSSKLRGKYVIFGVVGLMILYVLKHNEYFLVDWKAEIWAHYQPFKWWLLPHGLAGACAIFLGPMQFSTRLRQKYTKLHRVIGRIYIVGALVVAPLGAYIQWYEERTGGTRTFTAAAIVDALLLMTTTAIAFAFILNGKVEQHRQWMTRSFAVALIFVEVRVILGLTGLEKLGPHVVETVVWCCVAFSVPVGDIVLQLQESLRTRRVPVRAQAVSA